MTTQCKLISHLKYRWSSFRHEIGEDITLKSWLLGGGKHNLHMGILKGFQKQTDINGSILSCEDINSGPEHTLVGTRQ